MRSPKYVFVATIRFFLRVLPAFLGIAVLLVLYKPSAQAVPSYSRQTGLACSTCHYAPPELTPFGRKFKLEGYTFTTKPEVSEDKKNRNSGLNLLENLPLSAIFFASYSTTKSSQPQSQNGSFQFPQQASLFLAGSWGEHIGSSRLDRRGRAAEQSGHNCHQP